MTRRPRSAVAARLLRRFGANLAAARLRAGLTQHELADLAGVTQSYISAVEHGAQNLTVQSMVDLSAAVREDMVEMMTGTRPAQRAGRRLRAEDRRLETTPSEVPVRGGRVAMTDHVTTPEMAATLYVEAIERRELPAWIVFQDEPDYPGKVIARLATDTPTAYVLVADTLTELRAVLLPGLTLTERQPADPPES